MNMKNNKLENPKKNPETRKTPQPNHSPERKYRKTEQKDSETEQQLYQIKNYSKWRRRREILPENSKSLRNLRNSDYDLLKAPRRNKKKKWEYEGLYSFVAHPTVPNVQERLHQTVYICQLFKFPLKSSYNATARIPKISDTTARVCYVATVSPEDNK
ncbi:hypothetical protein TIFTF001_017080 [Ficus carica]|uniref:Uncharacterized protein n=1 Tax=Ficus carica TaxID=3494 RepID=A0AA88D6Q8_FICCA|nr:hypothetical protein TIFTF001_017080 [Ficus carica]